MKRYKNQKGIIHLIPLIIVFLLLAGVVAFLLFKTSALKRITGLSLLTKGTNKNTQETSNDQLDKVFGEKKEYSNPFEENKNPFDYLNE